MLLSMNRMITIAIICLMVTGCSSSIGQLSGSGSVRNFIRSGSGYVNEAATQAAATIELGKMGYEKAKETAEDLQKRADQFQQGVSTVKQGMDAVKEGKEMVEKAVVR